MKLDEFKGWLETAQAGEAATYHAGQTGSRGPASEEAWRAHERGTVHLVQRRADAKGTFYYLAIKRPRGRADVIELDKRRIRYSPHMRKQLERV